ncbi:hypothetical protein ACGFYF_37390 [Streptomyces lavendulae]
MVSEDEARALMVLLGLLGLLDFDGVAQPEDVRHGAGAMRFRIGSRLALPL